jgi:hypothetical protein
MLIATYNPDPNQKYIVTFDYVSEFVFDSYADAQEFIKSALTHSKTDILRAKVDIERPKAEVKNESEAE